MIHAGVSITCDVGSHTSSAVIVLQHLVDCDVILESVVAVPLSVVAQVCQSVS